MRNPSFQSIPIKALLFIIAMVAAPFFALIFGMTTALGVLAFALGMTTWLLLDAHATADPVHQPRLRLVAMINAILLALVLLVIVLRLVG